MLHGSLPNDSVLMPICLGTDASIRRQHCIWLAGAQGQGKNSPLGADADERCGLRQAEAIQRQSLQTFGPP